jgi:excisionase family DNA binding protein
MESTAEKTEHLISVEEVARILDVSTSTLYQWRVRRKGPPSYSIGGSVKYRRSEVEAWIGNQVHTA